MIEMALGILVDNLLVTDCGMSLRIPVHHPHSPVDPALLVEINEGIDDSIGKVGIHSELGPVPVAGCAELAELAENDSAVLLLPLPGIFEELLAGQIFLIDTLSLKPGDNLALCRNGGVVRTRNPAGILAVHPGLPDKNIIQRIVEHVAHMKDTRHVRRRNDDCIRLSFIRLRMKELLLQPPGVPLVFNL